MDYARKEGEEEALLNLDNPCGANGGDSSMVLSFLNGKANAGGINADLLLLNCGLHDIKTKPDTGAKQVTLEKYRENLAGIIEVVAGMKGGPRPIWIRTTPCDEAVHNQKSKNFYRYAADCAAYNRAADEIMTAAGVPLLDLYTFTVNLGSDLYADHVHFHPHIREKQAAFIAGWLMASQSLLQLPV
jgi:lysophospholipase L1-like esterase